MPIQRRREVKITVDGSYKSGFGGWAAFVLGTNRCLSGRGPCRSSTEAELRACLMALSYIRRNSRRLLKSGNTKVTVFTDCQATLRCCSQRILPKPKPLNSLGTKILRVLDLIPEELGIEFNYLESEARRMRRVDSESKRNRRRA